jgi:hypothetical protein
MAVSQMPLLYVGANPANGPDLVNRLQATNTLTGGPVNRTTVTSQIHTTATQTYAPKAYIDTQDATFALATYYQSQDALNVPSAVVGAINTDTNGNPVALGHTPAGVSAYGVASLDGNGQVPLAQMPVLGAGYLLGPFGPTSPVTAQTAGVGGAAAQNFVNFAVGVQNIPFQPMVYATVIASCASGGRPVIEARMSNGQAPYASQTLIARGMGRGGFTDPQAIAVFPCGPSGGETPASWPSTTNIFVSLWLFDLYQYALITTTGLVAGGVYLLRTGT